MTVTGVVLDRDDIPDVLQQHQLRHRAPLNYCFRRIRHVSAKVWIHRPSTSDWPHRANVPRDTRSICSTWSSRHRQWLSISFWCQPSAHHTDFVRVVQRARMYLAIQAALSVYPSRRINGHRNGSWRRGVAHSSHPRYIGRPLSFFVKRTDRDGLLHDRQHHVLFQDRIHWRVHITDLHERHEHGIMHNSRSWLRLWHWTSCAHRGRPADHLAWEGLQRRFLGDASRFVSIRPPQQSAEWPTWDSSGEHPFMMCSHSTLISHHLSVGHGLVDPNRQEFESFEDRSVGFSCEQ